MVKPDYTRDYYADLDLTPACNDEDIKRQHRRLALAFHPDRNRGEEAEYQPRFQAIQTAYDVLGDPELRAKYDASRRRGTVNNSFARPTPPRRSNPYQAKSNFPPPPRRTGPRPTSDIPHGAKGGAERYDRWTGPPPPQRERPPDAREKANAFSAWQAMNNAQKTQPKPPPRFNQPPPFPPRQRPAATTPDSPSGAATPPGAPQPRPTSNGSPPRPGHPGLYQTASAQQQPPRRPGFDPSAPSPGESHAPGPTMYSSAPRYDRENPPPMSSGKPPGFQPPPPAPTPPLRNAAPTARRPDPRSQFRAGAPDDAAFPDGVSRFKTPYAANVGEKTYVNPEKLQRTNSYRDVPKFSPQFHEPHLQPEADPRFQRRRSADSAATEATGNGDTEQPRWHTASQYRPWLKYSDSEESDEASPSAPPRPPKTRTASGDAGSATSSDRTQDDLGTQNRPKAQPTSRVRRYADQDPNFSGDGPPARNFDQPRTATGPPPSASSFPPKVETFARASNPELRGSGFGQDDANLSPTDTSNGTGNVSRNESHPNVSASHGGPEEAQIPADPQSRGDSAPHSAPADGIFHADQWSKDIQDDNWASKWANSPSGPASPARGASSIKRSRGPGSRGATRSNSARTPAVPHPVSVEEEEQGDPRSFTGAAGAARAESPDSNAMDIDTESLEERRPSIQVEDASGAPQPPRAVHVEPSRPEWRDDANTNGYFARRPSLPNNAAQSYGAPPPRANAPRLATQLSMDSFRHVAPFSKPAPSGLRHMDDLSSELPFLSQRSKTTPSFADPDVLEESKTPLPKPPKPPLIPQKVTQSNWTFYIEHMYAYISAWHDFNKEMADHFQKRELELREFEQNTSGAGTAVKDGGSGIVRGWLGAVGETAELKGWDTYISGMKEDQRWRTHWNVACDKHAAAIEAHAKLRERILNGEVAT